MSDDLKAKLDEAIQQITADEFEGRVVVGYNLTVAAVAMNEFGDGSATYCRWVSDGQPWHVSAGLAEAERMVLEGSWRDGGEV